MSFGATLREWRIAVDLSQRELARRVNMDFTYLSKIEAELVRPPAEDKIRALAAALGRDERDTQMLIELANHTKVPTETVNAVLIRNPEVGAFLRSIKNSRLTPKQSEVIRKFIADNTACSDECEGNGGLVAG